MTIQVINVFPDVPLYTMRTILSGKEYLFKFDYNERTDRYSLDISDIGGNPIVRAIKIVSSIPLLRKFKDDRLPGGQLVAFLLSNNNDEAPGFGELGEDKRVQLLYAEEEDLDEALDGFSLADSGRLEELA